MAAARPSIALRQPVATAIQAMRGIALINAVTIVAEVGDFSRFGNPRH
jgi:transposase